MIVVLRTQFQPGTFVGPRSSSLRNNLHSPAFGFSKTKTNTFNMESQSKMKRPTCPRCSKPLSTCLCSRFKVPSLDNKVQITILQHSLEKKHPLNSARIAKLGLKNLIIANVSDVHTEAQFEMRPLQSGFSAGLIEEEGENGESSPRVCRNVCESVGSGSDLDAANYSKTVPSSEYLQSGIKRKLNSDDAFECLAEKNNGDLGHNNNSGIFRGNGCGGHQALLSIGIEKFGKISSLACPWMAQNTEDYSQNLKEAIASTAAQEAFAYGFMVKKLQNQQESIDVEFEIAVPRGSALLFPSQDSAAIENVEFEVKNLIVLDGTWAKANRVYNENPWLKLLPCVRLDIDEKSLFSDVRHQPKPGYLSTLESIVYALKSLDEKDSLQGLDNLLEVFESMVEDQRRGKDERLRKKFML